MATHTIFSSKLACGISWFGVGLMLDPRSRPCRLLRAIAPSRATTDRYGHRFHPDDHEKTMDEIAEGILWGETAVGAAPHGAGAGKTPCSWPSYANA